MSRIVPTSAEQRMIHTFFARGHVEKVVSYKAGGGFNDQQILEQWRLFRDYLESPLGESLREEIMASARECHHHH